MVFYHKITCLQCTFCFVTKSVFFAIYKLLRGEKLIQKNVPVEEKWQIWGVRRHICQRNGSRSSDVPIVLQSCEKWNCKERKHLAKCPHTGWRKAENAVTTECWQSSHCKCCHQSSLRRSNNHPTNWRDVLSEIHRWASYKLDRESGVECQSF